MRKNYPTDLSEKEWEIIAPFFEKKHDKRGHPGIHNKREIVNAIFYIIQAGCAWRLLPHDFPSWKTVYNHFRDWQNLGIWNQINTYLVHQWRLQRKRKENPSAAIVDSQSVKTTEKGGSRVLTALRKSEGENVIFWWIPKEICCRLM